MQLQTTDAVWARIDALARQHPGGVVATDGDGTLWQGDVGEDLFRAFLEKGRWETPALDAVRHDARNHGLSDAGTGSDVAERIFKAFASGHFPEENICELMTWCFAGWTRREVQAFARQVVETAHLAGRIHSEVAQLIERSRAAGIEVVLVSASPLAVVLEAGATIGFDEAHVVAARAKFDGEVMAPAVERPIPYATGKVTRLRERIGSERMLYAALGDNVFDLAMLASSRIPVAVRPKPRLRERADSLPDIVELVPRPFPAGATPR